jgi:hypothetical protein
VYLPADELDQLDRGTYRLLHLFFDQIFVGENFQQLRRHVQDPEEGEFDDEWGWWGSKEKYQRVFDILCDGDQSTFVELRKVVRSIHDDRTARMYWRKCIYPYLSRGMIPLVSREIFEVFATEYLKQQRVSPAYFNTRYSQRGPGLLPGSYLWSARSIIETEESARQIGLALTSIFEKAYLKRVSGCQFILTPEQSILATALLKLKDVRIGELQNAHELRRVFAGDPRIGELLRVGRILDDQVESMNRTVQLVVPDLSEVPVVEIVRFRKKNRIKSLNAFCAEVMAKSPEVSLDEIVERLDEKVREVAASLKPGPATLILDVLGAIPTPGYNPASLITLYRSMKAAHGVSRQAAVFEYLAFRKRFAANRND